MDAEEFESLRQVSTTLQPCCSSLKAVLLVATEVVSNTMQINTFKKCYNRLEILGVCMFREGFSTDSRNKVCSSGYFVQWLRLKRSSSLQISPEASRQKYCVLWSPFKCRLVKQTMNWEKKKVSWFIFQILCLLDLGQTCDLLNSLTNYNGQNPVGKENSGYLTKSEVCRWQKTLGRRSEVTNINGSFILNTRKRQTLL